MRKQRIINKGPTMISFKIKVFTEKKADSVFFEVPDFKKTCSITNNGVCIDIYNEFPYKIVVRPAKNDKLKSISYTISTPLKNFHQVIVPDTGRTYASQMQLVDFWGKM